MRCEMSIRHGCVIWIIGIYAYIFFSRMADVLKINKRYEHITKGVLLLAVYAIVLSSLGMGVYLICYVVILMAIAIEDIYLKEIARENSSLLFLIAGIYVINSGNSIAFHILGMLLPGSIVFLVSIITKQAIGMGDVKLISAIGLLLGVVRTYNTLVYASLLGGMFSLVLLVCKRIHMKDSIPFAPFIVLGFYMVI